MAYYNTCPLCGSNLDPGEPCDCREEREKVTEFFGRHLRAEPVIGQMAFVFDDKEVIGYAEKDAC